MRTLAIYRALPGLIEIEASRLLRAGIAFAGEERIARKAAGCNKYCNWPVVVIPGRSAPRHAGEGCYFTTPGGKAIQYPNAYKWPKVYHASTNRIEVGASWLARRSKPQSLLTIHNSPAFHEMPWDAFLADVIKGVIPQKNTQELGVAA